MGYELLPNKILVIESVDTNNYRCEKLHNKYKVLISLFIYCEVPNDSYTAVRLNIKDKKCTTEILMNKVRSVMTA